MCSASTTNSNSAFYSYCFDTALGRHWSAEPSSLTAYSEHYCDQLVFSFAQKQHNEIELLIGNMDNKGYKLDISQQKMNLQDCIYTSSKARKEQLDFLKAYS